jgi:hypothetical protein
VLLLCTTYRWARGEAGGEISWGDVVSESSEGAALFAVAFGISPAKNPTTASIPSFILSRLSSCPLRTPRRSAWASVRSVSGVKMRVSLYPASFSKSSNASYVFDVPLRCRGTRPRSGYRVRERFVLGGVAGSGGELDDDCVKVGDD